MEPVKVNNVELCWRYITPEKPTEIEGDGWFLCKSDVYPGEDEAIISINNKAVFILSHCQATTPHKFKLKDGDIVSIKGGEAVVDFCCLTS